MTTDPFGHHGGPGDFTAPTSCVPCECTNSRVTPPGIPGLPLFESCPWHGCCVTSHQTIKCQWLWENGDRVPPDVWLPESHCPNFFTNNEYYPISTILPDRNALPWDQWESKDRLPYFPAAELFYSATITDATPTDNESRGLWQDRMEVQHLGWKLHGQKKVLKLAIEEASQLVERLEAEFSHPDRRLCFATVTRSLFIQLRMARRAIQVVERAEGEVVDMYQQMMRRTAAVLTMLNRMPSPGHTLTVADGTFSISREQLELGEAGREDVLDACERPLNKSRVLWKRLDDAVGGLLTPKKVKNNRGKGYRNRPIPANRGIKGQRESSKFM